MAVTTILFKRGNSPISQVNLRPGEPGWTLDTGKLYIGIETEHGRDAKLINVLDENDVQELLAQINSIKESLLSINTITGGKIYIQDTEPSDPDCVWIDTNGIDLITE